MFLSRFPPPDIVTHLLYATVATMFYVERNDQTCNYVYRDVQLVGPTCFQSRLQQIYIFIYLEEELFETYVFGAFMTTM